jgi:hypothetical protein
MSNKLSGSGIKNQKSIRLTKKGFHLKIKYKVVFSLLLLIAFLGLISQKLVGKEHAPSKVTTEVAVPTSASKSTWTTYTNAEFNYSLSYPIFLTVIELKDKGGYLEFTRFEENGLAADKGIAVGVRKNSLKAEVSEIKKEFEAEGDGNLTSEKNIKVGDYDAVRLDYEPKDSSQAEKRSIVIISNADYAFSISTIPEQMDKVLEDFKLL